MPAAALAAAAAEAGAPHPAEMTAAAVAAELIGSSRNGAFAKLCVLTAQGVRSERLSVVESAQAIDYSTRQTCHHANMQS